MERTFNTAIMISLIVGIVIVPIILIATQQRPEYFTELYFADHEAIPKFIEENQDYQYTFTIHNQEQKDMSYRFTVTIEKFSENNKQDIKSSTSYTTIPKGDSKNISINYKLSDFVKAKIETSIGNQNIHFFVYNKDNMIQYQDTIASVVCMKDNKIKQSDSFVIRAKGDLNPNMKVKVNGKEIYSGVISNRAYKNYRFNYPISEGILDIIFDNDLYNPDAKQDRNLYIESVTIGNTTLYPKDGILDLGEGAAAFDCQDVRDSESSIGWNGALRFKFTQ